MGCVCSSASESVSSQDHGKGRNRCASCLSTLHRPLDCQPLWTVSHSSHSVGLPQRLMNCLGDPDGGWAWIGCFSNLESAHSVPGLPAHWPPCKPPSTHLLFESPSLIRADINVDRPSMGTPFERLANIAAPCATKLPQRATVTTSPLFQSVPHLDCGNLTNVRHN